MLHDRTEKDALPKGSAFFLWSEFALKACFYKLSVFFYLPSIFPRYFSILILNSSFLMGLEI